MRIKRVEGLKHRSLIRIMWIFEPFNDGWPALTKAVSSDPDPADIVRLFLMPSV